MEVERLTKDEWAALKPGDEVVLYEPDAHPDYVLTACVVDGMWSGALHTRFSNLRVRRVTRLGRHLYAVRRTPEVVEWFGRREVATRVQAWINRLQHVTTRRLPPEVLAALDAARVLHEAETSAP